MVLAMTLLAAHAAQAVSPFDGPALQRTHEAIAAALRGGDLATADSMLAPLLAEGTPIAKALAAWAALAAGDAPAAAALAAAARAAGLGPGDVAPSFAPPPSVLTLDPALAARFAQPPPPADPRRRMIVDGVAMVGADNLVWDPARSRFAAGFDFPPSPPRRRLLNAKAEEGWEGRLLLGLRNRGAAAGLFGDLYDNRDRGHSKLDRRDYPELAFIEYAPAAQAAGLDYGLNALLHFDAPVIGNSSTALTGGPFWRSLVRAALTDPERAAQMAALAAENHLYVYPEHRDHDRDQGDLFPVNTPYVLISQGSSRSDQPLLRAAAAIYAAYRPDTKAFLRERGLLVPMTQRIFRRNLAGVESESDYLGPKAHPSVFRGEDIDVGRMIRAAQALRPEDVPPAPRIVMLRESTSSPNIEIFADGFGERLLDTPAAIGRVLRGARSEWRYLVSAAGTTDPNGRPLRFHWRVLRGAPGQATVGPLGPDGAAAEIVLRWAEPQAVPGDPQLLSNRVDVAVFADNGVMLSAPAFASFTSPPRERRTHDAGGRLTSIDYMAGPPATFFPDPQLYPRRDWRDDYAYDSEGRLLGWTRTTADGAVSRYTRHGALVIEEDALGRPIRAVRVSYPWTRREADGVAVVTPIASGRTLVYSYADDADRLGFLDPQD